MKTKIKIILIVVALVVILLAWAPWITDKYALNIVRNYIQNHALAYKPLYVDENGTVDINICYEKCISSTDVILKKLPFVNCVMTVEDMFCVTFYGNII